MLQGELTGSPCSVLRCHVDTPGLALVFLFTTPFPCTQVPASHGPGALLETWVEPRGGLSPKWQLHPPTALGPSCSHPNRLRPPLMHT